MTFEALVERGLRRVIAEKKTVGAFRLRDASFKGVDADRKLTSLVG